MRYKISTCSPILYFFLVSNLFGVEPTGPEHAEKMARGLDLFKREVRQILVGRCVKCHGGESIEGEFDLSTREGLLKGGAEGKAIALGNSKTSRLYRLITHEEGPEMPEDGAKLSENATSAIAKWIDLGAPYDKPLVEEDDDPLAWTRRKIDDSARRFWSFQPLRNVSPPQNESDDWSRTPIVGFINAKLRATKLTPNRVTDRQRSSAERIFDLIGLPPSPRRKSKHSSRTMIPKLTRN